LEGTGQIYDGFLSACGSVDIKLTALLHYRVKYLKEIKVSLSTDDSDSKFSQHCNLTGKVIEMNRGRFCAQQTWLISSLRTKIRPLLVPVESKTLICSWRLFYLLLNLIMAQDF